MVEWYSSNSGHLEVSNSEWTTDGGTTSRAGRLILHNNSTPVTITASLLKSPSASSATNARSSTATYVTGNLVIPAGFNPESPNTTFTPSLVEIQVTPNNGKIKKSGGPRIFHATGRNDDFTFSDLDDEVTWSLEGSPDPEVQLNSQGILTFGTFAPSGQVVTVKATQGSVTGQAQVILNP
jgi:hypothetical protein